MTVFALPAYRGRHYRTFAVVEKALTARQAQAWVRLGEAQPREEATIAQERRSVRDHRFRAARLGWLHPDEDTQPLFERLGALAEQANAGFGFDLIGFAEPVQYTVYEAPSVGYEWHYDLVDEPGALQRKLSLTVQLSDPREYEGGDLQFRDGFNVTSAPRGRGMVIAFPSWALHRVTPVTRGVRRSLVAWIGGPRFR